MISPTLQAQIAPYVAQFQQKQADSPRQRPAQPQLNDHEQQILRTAQAALHTWQASPAGQTQLQAMQQMNLAELNQALVELAQSPVLAPTLALVAEHATLGDTSFSINAITIGLKFELDIIIGIAGTLSIALDPTDIHGPSTSLLSIAVDEGIDGGGFAGVEFGIWQSAPSDLGGWAVSAEGTIDDVEGVSIAVTVGILGHSLGASITFAGGVNDGIEISESYTFILTSQSLGLPPIYQPDAAHFLILTSLKCVNTNESGHDEVYLNFQMNGGAVYPYPTWDYRSMAEDDVWNTGRSVKFNDSVYVAIKDDNETLVSCTIYLSDFNTNKNISKDLKVKNGLNEIEYMLYASLIY